MIGHPAVKMGERKVDQKLSPVPGDHEDFAGGVESEGDGAVAIEEAEDEGPRLGSILDEFAAGVEVESAFGEVAEEGRILVDDADDLERLAARERREGE